MKGEKPMKLALLDRERLYDAVTLEAGAHQAGDKACLLELAALLAGEAHTDHPKCVSPLLRTLAISVNDALDAHMRQALKPYARALIGTNDGHERERFIYLAQRVPQLLRAILAGYGVKWPLITDHVRLHAALRVILHAAIDGSAELDQIAREILIVLAGQTSWRRAALAEILATFDALIEIGAPDRRRARPARDVASGSSWAFTEHRSLAEV